MWSVSVDLTSEVYIIVKIEKTLLFLAPEEIPGGSSGQAWLSDSGPQSE